MNLGCGSEKIANCINIDINPELKPDLVLDFSKAMPFPADFVDEIYLFHVIEHIQEKFHIPMLLEFHRVLKPFGKLYISYPEFTKVAQNYIDNAEGKRDFWKATIYGRQLYPSDFHVSLMDSRTFVECLDFCGFKDITVTPEKREDFNTIIFAKKTGRKILYEDVLNAFVFGEKALDAR